MASKKVQKIRDKRKARVRAKISGSTERPRLSVFRSSKHIYVQAVADNEGKTIAHSSTISDDVKSKITDVKKVEAAKEVGRSISRKLRDMGIQEVVFDRGSYLYHGRVKALADGAREEGLKF
ncbi:50S ribosomal protein L18 [Syntrophus aciditrophicus]|uniref:Large ribosomal subunit protein uL18 n=1 Tax=Syntrophus aciditrophicus (strain SB) TaxID=56780 RepID=RL18_SYNAS|nr:50S ribosomal protein L18 [Syntrophus aciditrophicus]Q2LQC1.1 RecName: Full=Large ribosomal subunit protein uL18; AltName: Full=50S ribosomal protein L18 [Syntrophus aciditrophicus SB]ABC76197.1 LSU ribosomal protein L18P [Syntrophus aciditrophicus SB]OPY17621.1 MAG: 50S ribosomal protein L18 [Syntrophus sp. PtaB.Bin075]